jgi:hypothetical protein
MENEDDSDDMWDLLAALSQAREKGSVVSSGGTDDGNDLASLLGALKAIEPPSSVDENGRPVEIPHFPALSQAMLAGKADGSGIRTSGECRLLSAFSFIGSEADMPGRVARSAGETRLGAGA